MQVIWPDARRVVAGVENRFAVGDRPVMDLPREPVGLYDSITACDNPMEMPITPAGLHAARPEPAPFGFIDLRPESFYIQL
jgi:hypothetical protein